jgi:hypothetical protein
MRWLVLGLVVCGCGRSGSQAPADQSLPPRDLSAAVVVADLALVDLATVDLAPMDLATPVDQAVKLACGEPQMQCCISDGGKPWCNPTTGTCNQFGVCVACGIYPMACCPNGTCRDNQTCLSDPGVGTFCYPCGHDGQPCCFTGVACLEAGTSCIMPDGSVPICSH